MFLQCNHWDTKVVKVISKKVSDASDFTFKKPPEKKAF